MLTAEHKIIIVHLLPAGFAERYKRHVDKIEKIWPEWFQLGSQERSGIRALTFVKYSKLNTVNFVTVTRVGIWHQLQGDQYCEDQQQAKSHGAEQKYETQFFLWHWSVQQNGRRPVKNYPSQPMFKAKQGRQKSDGTRCSRNQIC
ncbi:hypothetical protein T4D_396 [Trichinella pseudospiralis]|uniref:Uncharacterized protein n=1 Tax=Trichinella pseudospiralis TaxID=6337 RepID=A0A0V1G1Z8_TRIPS|nr:hypothetical protein T4D_396 [Trichinella pseudospiralis]